MYSRFKRVNYQFVLIVEIFLSNFRLIFDRLTQQILVAIFMALRADERKTLPPGEFSSIKQLIDLYQEIFSKWHKPYYGSVQNERRRPR